MAQFINNFLPLVVFVVLMIIGFAFGRLSEKRHYKSIRGREDEYRDIVIIPGRQVPQEYHDYDGRMVQGSVVVAVDYFKVVVAGLRNFIGGRIASFESLLDRARREAVLRVQEEARALDASVVFNLKFETSRISGRGRNKKWSIEVLAYGTALSPRNA